MDKQEAKDLLTEALTQHVERPDNITEEEQHKRMTGLLEAVHELADSTDIAPQEVCESFSLDPGAAWSDVVQAALPDVTDIAETLAPGIVAAAIERGDERARNN